MSIIISGTNIDDTMEFSWLVPGCDDHGEALKTFKDGAFTSVVMKREDWEMMEFTALVNDELFFLDIIYQDEPGMTYMKGFDI